MVSGLKELGEFVGFGDATMPPVDGSTNFERIATSLVAVGTHLPLINQGITRSLRELITALPTLPAIGFDVTNTNGLNGSPNFAPEFRVATSPGNVFGTVVNVFDSAGRNLLKRQKDLPLAFQGPVETFPNLGQYTVRFDRFGVTAAGLQILQHEFPVSITPAPAPPPRPLPAPVISVVSNGDGSFKVSGSGFKPGGVVTIRIVDARGVGPGLFLQVTADGTGAFKDFPTGKICGIPGASIVFSGQDVRIDPSTHQVLSSNFVTISCPE